MHDEADVALVNTHAEGDRGDHHVNLVAGKGILVARARLRVESGVIRGGADTLAG